jgi:hypothetical protein
MERGRVRFSGDKIRELADPSPEVRMAAYGALYEQDQVYTVEGRWRGFAVRVAERYPSRQGKGPEDFAQDAWENLLRRLAKGPLDLAQGAEGVMDEVSLNERFQSYLSTIVRRVAVPRAWLGPALEKAAREAKDSCHSAWIEKLLELNSRGEPWSDPEHLAKELGVSQEEVERFLAEVVDPALNRARPAQQESLDAALDSQGEAGAPVERVPSQENEPGWEAEGANLLARFLEHLERRLRNGQQSEADRPTDTKRLQVARALLGLLRSGQGVQLTSASGSARRKRRALRVDQDLLLQELGTLGTPWRCPGGEARGQRRTHSGGPDCKPCRDALYKQVQRVWEWFTEDLEARRLLGQTPETPRPGPRFRNCGNRADSDRHGADDECRGDERRDDARS